MKTFISENSIPSCKELLLGKRLDIYDQAAYKLLKKFQRELDRANYDYAAFVLAAADILRKELGGTPTWLSQALNEGDGVYRP